MCELGRQLKSQSWGKKTDTVFLHRSGKNWRGKSNYIMYMYEYGIMNYTVIHNVLIKNLQRHASIRVNSKCLEIVYN